MPATQLLVGSLGGHRCVAAAITVSVSLGMNWLKSFGAWKHRVVTGDCVQAQVAWLLTKLGAKRQCLCASFCAILLHSAHVAACSRTPAPCISTCPASMSSCEVGSCIQVPGLLAVVDQGLLQAVRDMLLLCGSPVSWFSRCHEAPCMYRASSDNGRAAPRET